MTCQAWPRFIPASRIPSRGAGACCRSFSWSCRALQQPQGQRRPSRPKNGPAQAQKPWPLLRRRSEPGLPENRDQYDKSLARMTANRGHDNASKSTKCTSAPEPSPAVRRSHRMLTVSGLAPTLKASDFARLSSTDLSAWQHAITKVQQQRHPDTYEPLGRYTMTFSTAEAAATYHARLLRLHSLAGRKVLSRQGPGQCDAPRGDLTGSQSDARDPAGALSNHVDEQASQYTLALGTQLPLDAQRSRVTIARPWAPKISALVEGDGYGEHPHLVMLDVSPSVASADDLYEQIGADAETRGTRWSVSKPHSLAPPAPQPQPTTIPTTGEATMEAEMAPAVNNGDEFDPGLLEEGEYQEHAQDVVPPKPKQPAQHNRSTRDVLGGRFIISCSDEAEARRFHRYWNMRCLRTRHGHHVAPCIIRARIMEW